MGFNWESILDASGGVLSAVHDEKASAALHADQVTADRSSRALLAVLLNPPATSSGARSRRAVSSAAEILGFDHVSIVNLFEEQTPSISELNRIEMNSSSWTRHRQHLIERMRDADSLLAAWGVSGASGRLRRERDTRAAWLLGKARGRGIESVWTVGGEPRHPSRWHQYVGTQHGRYAAGTFEERLGRALTLVSIRGVAPGKRNLPS